MRATDWDDAPSALHVWEQGTSCKRPPIFGGHAWHALLHELRGRPEQGTRERHVTDVLRHDAAIAAATTVWTSDCALVLPLTAALPSIHGARLCSEARGRYRRLSWMDEPVPTRKRRWFSPPPS